MALVSDRRKKENNNIEIAYFIGAWRFVFPIIISQFKLAMEIRKARLGSWLSWDCSLADYDDCPHSKAASNKIVFNIPPHH